MKPRPPITGYFERGGRGLSLCPLKVSTGDTPVILATPPPKITFLITLLKQRNFYYARQKLPKPRNKSVTGSIMRTSVKTLSDKDTKELRLIRRTELRD